MLPKRARPAPALRGGVDRGIVGGRLGDQCLPAQAAAKSGELHRNRRCIIPQANVIAQPANPVLQLKNLFHAADSSAWFGRPKHASVSIDLLAGVIWRALTSAAGGVIAGE